MFLERQYYDMTSFERRIHCQEVSGKFKLEFMTRRIQKYASPQPPVSYPQSQRSNKITYPLTAAQIASINHSHSATSITNGTNSSLHWKTLITDKFNMYKWTF